MSNITYHHHVDGITAHQLRRFHVGWPNPPSPESFLISLFNMNALRPGAIKSRTCAAFFHDKFL